MSAAPIMLFPSLSPSPALFTNSSNYSPKSTTSKSPNSSTSPITTNTKPLVVPAVSSPTLPLPLVDLILSLIPKTKPRMTTQLSTLHVLPLHQIPTTFACLLRHADKPPEFFAASANESKPKLPKIYPFISPNALLSHHPLATSPILLAPLVPVMRKDPHFATHMVVAACKHGNLACLNAFVTLGLPIGSTLLSHQTAQCVNGISLALIAASHGGHTQILDWWINLGISLECPSDALTRASQAGQLDVLDWWAGSGIMLVYDQVAAILSSCIHGHVAILDWWYGFLGPVFTYNPEYIVAASENGHTIVLQWFVDHGYQVCCDVGAIDYAAAAGHVNVLNWWVESNLKLMYTTRAMKWASRNGHLDVLKWFAASGLELRFTPNASVLASLNGHAHCVQWWNQLPKLKALIQRHQSPNEYLSPISSELVVDLDTLSAFGRRDLLDQVTWHNLPSVSTPLAAIHAAQFGHVDVLTFWESLTPMPLAAKECIKIAARCGQVHVLQWIAQRGHASLQDWQACPVIAASNNQVQVLDWMLEMTLLTSDQLQSNGELVNGAIEFGHVDVLEWCMANAIRPLLKSKAEMCIVGACMRGHVHVLEWWHKNTLPICTESSLPMDIASAYGHYLVLQWWVMVVSPVVWSEYAVRIASRFKHARVLAWWRRSGLLTDPQLLQLCLKS